MTITAVRAFFEGNTTEVGVTLPGGPNLLTATVQVSARRDDGNVITVDGYDYGPDGTFKFNMNGDGATGFTVQVVSETGIDHYQDLNAYVLDGASAENYRLFAPDGRFDVLTIP